MTTETWAIDITAPPRLLLVEEFMSETGAPPAVHLCVRVPLTANPDVTLRANGWARDSRMWIPTSYGRAIRVKTLGLPSSQPREDLNGEH